MEVYWCFLKWYPQIIQFNMVFHCKPSILGYPYFRKHPYIRPGNICNMMINSCHHGTTSSHGVGATPSGQPVFFLVGSLSRSSLKRFQQQKAPENHWGGWLVGSDEFPFVFFFFSASFCQVGTGILEVQMDLFFKKPSIDLI